MLLACPVLKWRRFELCTGNSDVSLMFFTSVLHRYFSLANVDLTAFTENPLNPPPCLAGSTAFFGRTRCDLKKSPT